MVGFPGILGGNSTLSPLISQGEGRGGAHSCRVLASAWSKIKTKLVMNRAG